MPMRLRLLGLMLFLVLPPFAVSRTISAPLAAAPSATENDDGSGSNHLLADLVSDDVGKRAAAAKEQDEAFSQPLTSQKGRIDRLLDQFKHAPTDSRPKIIEELDNEFNKQKLWAPPPKSRAGQDAVTIHDKIQAVLLTAVRDNGPTATPDNIRKWREERKRPHLGAHVEFSHKALVTLETHYRVQEAAARTLHQVMDEHAVPVLIELAGKEDTLARTAVIECLEAICVFASHIHDDTVGGIWLQRAFKAIRDQRLPLASALNSALRDPEAGTRAASAALLIESPIPQCLETLKPLLRDPIAKVRAKAAEALGAAGDESLLAEIPTLLNDPETIVREHAVFGLGRLGGDKATDLVIGALGQKNVGVRNRAVQMLGKLKARRAVPLLIGLIQDDQELIGRNAIDSLVMIGDPAAVPGLLSLLESGGRGMRSDIVEAIRKIEARRLTVSLAVVEPKVPFGGELKIEATLSNLGDKPILVPRSAIRFVPSGWSAKDRGGTGLGDDIRIPAKNAAADLTIPAGGKATVQFTDREHTVVSLGPIECDWRPQTEDPTLLPLLGHPEASTIRFDVQPSQLIRSAWAARNDEERAKVLADVKELLILRADTTDWRQRHLVEGTFEYMAGAALSLLDLAAKDVDPQVRAQAIEQYRYSAWAVGNMKNKLDHAASRSDAESDIGQWAKLVPAADEKAADEACVRTALTGLTDKDSLVRLSAVHVLTWIKHGPADAVKQLTSDSDSHVRAAVQEYMALFGGNKWSAETLVAAIRDPSEEVRNKAIEALETSPEPPPLATLKSGFAVAKGQTAIRLLTLLFEQEDENLPAALLEGFDLRSEEERLAILAAVAGHADDATLDLARRALSDRSPAVQRQGLLRLLPFSSAKVDGILADHVKTCPAELKPLAEAVRKEVSERKTFPFLSTSAAAADTMAWAEEKEFPSHNGTMPMSSPDGQWLAYVETGWGRPGGSGGTGRSNLLSLVHVVGKDGKNDRIVSDMFLVGWMGDSRRLGSSRDGYAAVSDIDGKIVSEFGTVLPDAASQHGKQWAQGQLREQMGTGMPHSKRVKSPDYAEQAAFSPDGKWLGPLLTGREIVFLGTSGDDLTIPWLQRSENQATWSPDGKHVIILGGKSVTVVDFIAHKAAKIEPVVEPAHIESWEYRKCRWNPWSRDGAWLALLRGGQVWACKPDGQAARQLTWGSRAKAFPTFSPDGKQMAYLCYQDDRRLHYRRLGPTDLWVVDFDTGMETRVTKPDAGRIHCLDWLDRQVVIFDRLDQKPLHYASSLRTASLGSPQ